jgi:hypothetical protein
MYLTLIGERSFTRPAVTVQFASRRFMGLYATAATARFVNVASVAYVINFQTGIVFVDAVDDAIAPYAIRTIALEFASQLHTHVTLCE